MRLTRFKQKRLSSQESLYLFLWQIIRSGSTASDSPFRFAPLGRDILAFFTVIEPLPAHGVELDVCCFCPVSRQTDA